MEQSSVAATYWILHPVLVAVNLRLLHRALESRREWHRLVLAGGYAVIILSVLLGALAGIYVYGLVLGALVIVKAPLGTLGAMVAAAPFGLLICFGVLHGVMRLYVRLSERLLPRPSVPRGTIR